MFQRGAEVIDEQGDTVPLPAVPSESDPQPRPPFGPILKKVALGVAACLVAGAGYAGLQHIANAPADPNSRGTHQPAATTSSPPDQAQDGVQRAVAGDAVLQKLTDAVENENRTEFMSVIDPK